MDLVAHMRAESARFAAVLADADPSARVPTCPDWTAGDLLWHLTEVHFLWAAMVRDRLDSHDAAEATKPSRPATHVEMLARFDDSTDALAAAFEATPDDVAIWTWASRPEDRTVGFARRFQAHEALMHRVDAELAAGLPPTLIPGDLAADRIDVVLDFVHSWRPEWATWEPTDTIGLLQATDTGQSWTVQVGAISGTAPGGGWALEHEPTLALVDGDPTFEVSASAADLDAWLWNRPGFGDVRVDGSAEAFEQLRAKISAGTP